MIDVIPAAAGLSPLSYLVLLVGFWVGGYFFNRWLQRSLKSGTGHIVRPSPWLSVLLVLVFLVVLYFFFPAVFLTGPRFFGFTVPYFSLVWLLLLLVGAWIRSRRRRIAFVSRGSSRRPPRPRFSFRLPPRPRDSRLSDYSALLSACLGDRPTVERLIAYEQSRRPGLSRGQATSDALDRLRYERSR